MECKYGRRSFIKEILLSVLFPQKCPVCGRIIKDDGQALCRECKAKLPVITGARCIKCSKPVGAEGALCGDCKKRKHAYTCGYALWNYDSCTGKLIKEFKYSGRRDYADWLVWDITCRIL